MKFDTPATKQPHRPAEGRRQARRSHRRPAQDHRHRALRQRPARRRREPGVRLHRRARPSPRAASPRWTSPPRRPRPACIAIVTAQNAGKLGKGNFNTALLLGGPRSSITTRRSRSSWPRPSSRRARRPTWCASQYARGEGRVRPGRGEGPAPSRPTASAAPAESEVGDFAGAFAAAPVQLDATYTTAHESHSMMEPHATHRRVGWRPAHALDLEPDDRLDRGRHGEDARHPEGEGAASCRPTSAAASARSCGCARTRCWPRSARARRAGR